MKGSLSCNTNKYIINTFHLFLKDAYNNDVPQGTRQWLRRLMALALKPVARVSAAFDAVMLASPGCPKKLTCKRTCRPLGLMRTGGTALFHQIFGIHSALLVTIWEYQLVLADDGLNNKILVLCTPENLRRFVELA
jgi:hypothetical protein